MHVIRNTYKSRHIAYEDDAYNLPLDTVYFIESQWNHHLNEYVYTHKEEIEKLLNKDIGGLYPYKLEIISLSRFDNPLTQKAIRDLHPEMDGEIDFSQIQYKYLYETEQDYQTAMLQRMMSDQPYFEATFIARTLPKEDEDLYHFYAIDISLCTEALILEILEKFVYDLNYLNLSILGENDFWRDYEIHDEVLPIGDLQNFGGNMDWGVASAIEASPSNTEDDINNLIISPALRDLATRLKEEVESYQRDNGINILLEDKFNEFIQSLTLLEPQPLSALEVSPTFSVYLTSYKKEIKMHTFHKAIYIFFLRHPDGIYLKDISVFRDELYQIYRTLIRQDLSNSKIEERIERVLTLTNGILNQYISRISQAFRNNLSSDLAKKYVIAGKRKSIRRILLPQDMITLPDKLKF